MGQRMLFNILRAYAVYDNEVGYTQGMSGLGALLLMYMSEEDAFWCLVTLMQEERYCGFENYMSNLLIISHYYLLCP